MNLLRTLAAISSMTMLSRITGLLQHSLFARAFGSNAYSDAFLIAFRLPNMLRRLFAEGAFSQAFVPLLSEYKNKHCEPETKEMVDLAATALVWSTLMVSIVGIVTAPVLIYWLVDAKEHTQKSYDAMIFMTRFMFPYIVCMSFVAMAGGVLNTWRQFKIPAFTPVLLNICLISAALLLAPLLATPIYAMAIGVMVGGLAQMALQVPSLVKIGMLPRLRLNPMRAFRNEGVRRILQKMGPALLGVSAGQISLLINTTIAGNMAAGSISALSYADRLMEFPTAMLGVALGTILMPSLAKASVNDDTAEYSGLLNWGLRLTFLLALPAAVGLAALAVPVIATLFNYGQFDTKATLASATPLMAYSAGLIGIIVVKILTPAFYSRQDFKTPVRIAILTVVAVQLMNLVLVPTMGVAGLALSIGLGACVNAICLFVVLYRRRMYVPQAGWALFFLKLLVAVAVMGAMAWYASAQFVWTGPDVNGFVRAGLLFAIIAACAVAYFAVLFALGFRLGDFKRTAKPI